MKIETVRITPIAVDDPPLRNAAGLHAPYALRTIVELVGDNGIIASPKKFQFSKRVVDFAGFVVGETTVQPLPKYIDATFLVQLVYLTLELGWTNKLSIQIWSTV